MMSNIKPPANLLSKQAKEIAYLMRYNKGSFLKGHMRPNGEQCYRLMDAKINPICNVTANKVMELIQNGFVEKGERRLVYNGKQIR